MIRASISSACAPWPRLVCWIPVMLVGSRWIFDGWILMGVLSGTARGLQEASTEEAVLLRDPKYMQRRQASGRGNMTDVSNYLPLRHWKTPFFHD